MSKKTILSIVLILSIMGLALFLFNDRNSVFNQAKFNQAVWQAEATNSEPLKQTRGKMVGDLLRNYLRKGMTRTQVLDLLGSPDESDSTHQMSYWLGACSGYGIDPDILNIYFDKSGVVKQITVGQS